jgi:uncharacterized phage protein (TIGR01671 family)
MNREIKFRAWDKRNKTITMPYVLDYRPSYKDNDYIMVQTPDGRGDISLWGNTKEHIVLMQFIGVIDKNKKEIYEGDIAKWHAGGAYGIKYGDVYFDNGRFLIRGFNIGFLEDPSDAFEEGLYLFEIVGNVYETPELLLNKN